METINIQVPEGRKAEQITDSEGNITIKFVEKKDNNPFRKGLSNTNIEDLRSFCEKAFGDRYNIVLTHDSIPNGREDLVNRSLLVYNYEVILHKNSNRTTVIEFKTR